MTDELLEALPMVAVATEAGALALAYVRKNVSGIVLVNALGAAGVMTFIVPELRVSIQFLDVFFLLQLTMLAFAVATLTTSLSWLAHPIKRSLAVWTEFSIIAGLSAALLLLVLVLRAAQLT